MNMLQSSQQIKQPVHTSSLLGFDVNVQLCEWNKCYAKKLKEFVEAPVEENKRGPKHLTLVLAFVALLHAGRGQGRRHTAPLTFDL